jgi:predicted MFS family arabinose efflux permease
MMEELKKEKIYVTLLAAIQFAHILDFVIMMPLGPQFMRIFNINPTQFSLVVSVYTLAAGIVGLIGAIIGDKYDRKKFLVFCFLGFILGTWFCAIAKSYSTLLMARIVAGAFGGILNAIVMSLAADLIPPERRGAATGVIMSAFSLASVIGVPIGLLIASKWDYSYSFYFIVVLSLIILFCSLLLIPSIIPVQKHHTLSAQIKNIWTTLKNPFYLKAFLMSSTLSFSVLLIVPFISGYMVRNVGLTESELPLIYLLGGGFTVLSARYIGKWCDRSGSFKVFSSLLPLSFIPILLLTHLPSTHLYLALGVTTFFMMFVSGRFIPIMTMNSLVVKQHDRGTFMGLENSLRQFASGLAASLGGFILTTTPSGKLLHYNINGYLSIFFSILTFLIAKNLSLHSAKKSVS